MKVQAILTGEEASTLEDTALHTSHNHKVGNKGGKASVKFEWNAVKVI